MADRISDENRRISPKDDIYGYVTEVSRYDGKGDYGTWTRINLNLVRPVESNTWNSDSRSFDITEQYLTASLKPKTEEDAQRWLQMLQPRDETTGFAGTYVHITGWVGLNKYKDKATGQWKTSGTAEIKKAKLDETFVLANNDIVHQSNDDDMGLDDLGALDSLGDF